MLELVCGGLLLWLGYYGVSYFFSAVGSLFDSLAAGRRRRQEGRLRQRELNQQMLLNLKQQRCHKAAEGQRRRNLNELARLLQVALLQLGRANDFARAAHVAARCQGLPEAFRRRQFARFKPLIAEHLYRRLSLGEKPEALLLSLLLLLKQLGIQEHEGRYLMDNVRRRRKLQQPPPPPKPTVADQLRRERLAHQHRLQAIRTHIEEGELQEQLIEQEQIRHQAELVRLIAGQRRGDNDNVVTI